MPRTDPPVFVVGSFRGGTTLMERVLLAHPEIVGPGFETQLYSRVRYRRRLDHPEEFRALLGDLAGADPIEQFEEVMTARVHDACARCWVEKTPEHVYHVRALRKRFDGARIVHVMRDGRDVVTSIAHTPWIFPRVRDRFARIVGAVVLWELMTFEGLRLMRDPALEDALTSVRYERLVQEPERELSRLASWLGLAASEADVANWLRRAQEVKGNSLIDSRIGGISPAPVGRWRSRHLLSGRELATVQELAGDTLVRAGYELVLAELLPARTRAAAWALKAAWLGVRLQRYAMRIGRGTPPHLVSDARAALAPLVKAQIAA